MDVLAATDARAAEVHAVKEFAQTDSGLSSPVNPKEAVGNEEAGNGMKINNKSNEEVTVPATIAMWQEEAISGNSSLIDRVMEAESRATSPTPAEDEGEADEPTVWVADENAEEEGIDEMATAVETFEDTKEKDGATAASKAGRAAIPTTIAMWDDEKRPDSPPRVSADERFARLKEARLRGVHMQNATELPVSASSMVLAAVDTVTALQAGSIASLPAGADLTSPSRFAGRESGAPSESVGLTFQSYGNPTDGGDPALAATPVVLDAEYQYQTAPTRMVDLGPSEKTPLFQAEDKGLRAQGDTCEMLPESCTVM